MQLNFGFGTVPTRWPLGDARTSDKRLAATSRPLYRGIERLVKRSARQKGNRAIAEKRKSEDQLRDADEAHFVALGESEPLVNRSTLVGGMKHEPIDLLDLGPGDNLFNE